MNIKDINLDFDFVTTNFQLTTHLWTVETKFLYPDNSSIDIFLYHKNGILGLFLYENDAGDKTSECNENQIILTDASNTLSWLTNYNFFPQETHVDIFNDILNQFNIKLNKGKMEKCVSQTALRDGIFELAHGCARVSDLLFVKYQEKINYKQANKL